MRIAVIGTFDLENYGDLLFPVVLKHELKIFDAQTEIVLFSPIGGNMPFAKGQMVYPIADMMRIHKETPLQAIVIGGGDILRMDSEVASQEKYAIERATVALWIWPILFGYANHLPVCMNCPGVPFSFTKTQAEWVKFLMNMVDYISVRDLESKQHLVDAGVETQILVVPDSVLLVDRVFSPTVRDQAFQELCSSISFLADPKGYLVLQLNNWEASHTLEDYRQSLRKLIEQTNLNILFMPIGYVHSDVEIANRIVDGLEDPRIYALTERKLTPLQMLAVISRAHYFIGTSLHGCLTAFVFEVPFLTVHPIRLVKMAGFLQWTDQQKREVLSLEAATGMVAGLMSTSDFPQIRETLQGLVTTHFEALYEVYASCKEKDARDVLTEICRKAPISKQFFSDDRIFFVDSHDEIKSCRLIPCLPKNGNRNAYERIVVPTDTKKIVLKLRKPRGTLIICEALIDSDQGLLLNERVSPSNIQIVSGAFAEGASWEIPMVGKVPEWIEVEANVIDLDLLDDVALSWIYETLNQNDKQISQMMDQLQADNEQLTYRMNEQCTKYEIQLEEQRTRNEARLEAQRADFEAELQDQRTRNEARLEAQRADFEAELQDQRARSAARLEAQRADFEAQLQDQQTRSTARLEAQRADFEARLEEQQAQSEAQRADYEAQLHDQRIQFEKQMSDEHTRFMVKFDEQRTQYNQDLGRLQISLTLAEQNYEAISNALWWRVSAPIRKVITYAKLAIRGNVENPSAVFLLLSKIRHPRRLKRQPKKAQPMDARIVVVPTHISVTVVIPTKNAGITFPHLLEMLKKQEGFDKIHIVVVDSGSSDDTVQIAQKMGARMVRIKPEDFSHSYSRNLGVSKAETPYVLLITQDAMPSSPQWLFQMYQPIMKDPKIVAVSCAETPREDADLYGLACSWGHAQFMGVLNQDKIMEMPPEAKRSFVTIRQNSNLNDVACLVNKAVFEKFKYRFDYAEDLDLGKRLIENGHKLALLGSVKVIHSHTRPAFYYLRRAYVEIRAFYQIFPDQPITALSDHDFLFGAKMLFETTSNLIKNMRDLPAMPSERYVKLVTGLFGQLHGNSIGLDESVWGVTADLVSFYRRIDDLYRQQTEREISQHAIACFKAFFDGQSGMVLNYLTQNFPTVTSEVNKMVGKAFMCVCSSAVGNILASTFLSRGKDPNFQLKELCADASKGV